MNTLFRIARTSVMALACIGLTTSSFGGIATSETEDLAKSSGKPEQTQEEVTLDRKATVEGFTVLYNRIETPRDQWNEANSAKDWFGSVTGQLKSSHALSYRKVTVPAGTHDVWIEAGDNGWYYLRVGHRKDAEQPRLKAAFKLYEEEDGVERLDLTLKLVSKGKKLKFSVRAGAWEGHGNLRIQKKDSKEPPVSEPKPGSEPKPVPDPKRIP